MSATGALTEISLTRATFRALFGPIVWAAHFTLLYAIHTALCVYGAGAAMGLASAALTIGALVALWLYFLRRRDHATTAAAPDRFLDRLSMLLILLSAGGVTWAGAASALIEPCAQLR